MCVSSGFHKVKIAANAERLIEPFRPDAAAHPKVKMC
jgi:hypothetical protein